MLIAAQENDLNRKRDVEAGASDLARKQTELDAVQVRTLAPRYRTSH